GAARRRAALRGLQRLARHILGRRPSARTCSQPVSRRPLRLHLRGAPRMSLMTAPGPRLGLDIGGTKMLAVLADPSGTVLAQRERPTPARSGAQSIVTTAAELLREVALAGGMTGPLRRV